MLPVLDQGFDRSPRDDDGVLLLQRRYLVPSSDELVQFFDFPLKFS